MSADQGEPTPHSVVRSLKRDPRRPFLVLLELTRACDMACWHCRASSLHEREPDELSTKELFRLFEDLSSLGPPRPLVVLTGGDPMMRPDLVELVGYGSSLGLAMAVSPAGTPRANFESLTSIREAGCGVVSFSLDGASSATHDALRRVAGSFEWTLDAARAAKAAGLRLMINSTVSRENLAELPALAELASRLSANLWSVFLLVPTGRARLAQPLSAQETEDVLHFLADLAGSISLKATEAPAYRRVLIQRARSEELPRGPLYNKLANLARLHWPKPASPGTKNRPPLAVGDGRGVVFVSSKGEVSPSGFLPLVVGNIREAPLSEIYAGSPVLRALQDPNQLRGRCGRCPYRDVCGGSRAQAWARSGDYLAEDPTCPFDPALTEKSPTEVTKTQCA